MDIESINLMIEVLEEYIKDLEDKYDILENMKQRLKKELQLISK